MSASPGNQIWSVTATRHQHNGASKTASHISYWQSSRVALPALSLLRRRRARTQQAAIKSVINSAVELSATDHKVTPTVARRVDKGARQTNHSFTALLFAQTCLACRKDHESRVHAQIENLIRARNPSAFLLPTRERTTP